MGTKTNIIPSDKKYSVQIYEGLTLICKSDIFKNSTDAYDSAKRIMEQQKKILGDKMTAYAMVFEDKRMLYYFD